MVTKNTQKLSDLLSRPYYTKDDTVLVADTSFLTRLSSSNVWAFQAYLTVEQAAQSKKGPWLLRMPVSVIAQYKRLLAEKTSDDFGNPLAQKSIEDILGEWELGSSLIAAQSSEVATKIWQQSREGVRQYAERGKLSPGRADTDIITFAVGIANQGADVYVLSYDFKDVIRPLEGQAISFEQQGLRITPLGPSPLKSEHFRRAGLPVKAVVTGALISKLQNALSTASYQDYAVFEKNVRSGDMEFDAGVGVVRKEYLRTFELPQEFSMISQNYRLVPIVKIKAAKDASTKRRLGNKLKELNTPHLLLVVDKSKPFSPFLLEYYSQDVYVRSILLRADLDFLHYQTSSLFANETYVPAYTRDTSKTHR